MPTILGLAVFDSKRNTYKIFSGPYTFVDNKRQHKHAYLLKTIVYIV